MLLLVLTLVVPLAGAEVTTTLNGVSSIPVSLSSTSTSTDVFFVQPRLSLLATGMLLGLLIVKTVTVAMPLYPCLS